MVAAVADDSVKQFVLLALLIAIVVAVVVLPRKSASFKALSEYVETDPEIAYQIGKVSNVSILKSRSIAPSPGSSGHDWYFVRIEGASGAIERRYQVEKQGNRWRVTVDSDVKAMRVQRGASARAARRTLAA